MARKLSWLLAVILPIGAPEARYWRNGAFIAISPVSVMMHMLKSSAWKVGACQADAKTARCPVALSYVPPPAARAPKPANWNDTILLVNTPKGWKVDDVIYDAGFAFGNTGRLSGMLQMVVAANP